MNHAICAKNIGKKFLINHAKAVRQAKYRTFREALMDAIARPLRDLRQGAALGAVEEFWALRDISFDLAHGDVVGIIGRNGAGKSTLLKILTRITEPSEGRITLQGRVGSLLEVGTGFHPELTGRENVFLNGSILGMRRAEINSKFDEIVDFSGVEKFIDTPVKRYSSGMKVRLAFAVAAHLDLEILLVDEVLAVGDADFQQKCLGKMDQVASGGRTVLFVSHNMGAISRLCPKCIWLEDGRMHDFGESREVILDYLKASDASYGQEHAEFPEDRNKDAQVRKVTLLNEHGVPAKKFDCDSPICIELQFAVHRTLPGMCGYLEILDMEGTKILVSDSLDSGANPFDNLPVGMHRVRISVPPRTLAAGNYHVYLNFTSPSAHKTNVDSPGIVGSFSLDDFTSRRGNRRKGFFSTLLDWRLAAVPRPASDNVAASRY